MAKSGSVVGSSFPPGGSGTQTLHPPPQEYPVHQRRQTQIRIVPMLVGIFEIEIRFQCHHHHAGKESSFFERQQKKVIREEGPSSNNNSSLCVDLDSEYLFVCTGRRKAK